jgi:ComF family protein
MLKIITEILLWPFFPTQCETCSKPISPFPPSGVCGRCEGEIKRLRPPYCALCGRPVQNEGARCASCLEENFAFDRAFACALYEGKMKELIHRYKFDGRHYLRHFFSRLMLSFIQNHLRERSYETLAAVPMDRAKKQTRGFNQSELLSARLAKTLGLPEASHSLRRRGRILPQSLLAKKDRKTNAQGSFEVTDQKYFDGKNVLLIDDILTTGHTASECAGVLKKAGARSVEVLACARGL